MGKVVLEKLLRTVTGVGRVYVLIRGNRTWPSARERFVNEVATSSIFDTLREQQPELFEHHCRHTIRCITGELTESRFGLSESAFRQLGQDVDLIINAAASV
ncbi:SDR family oxidoreductase, partial [Arthrospira platensis SPKY1]|nr:SDR family oxidoreductase [Arthrospira platensis SPKY1]